MKEIGFLDHESPFSHHENLTVQQIVINHIRYLGYQLSDDMSGGRWDRIPMASGEVVERWIPDRRLVLYHSVDYLLLLTRSYLDEQAQKELEEVRERFEEEKEADPDSLRDLSLEVAKERFGILADWIGRSNWLNGSPEMEAFV